MDSAGTRFVVNFPDEDLAALKTRLQRVRWPQAETVSDWSQGVPLARLQELVAYWQSSYEWRPCERLLNETGLFSMEIDGLEIAYLHVRSPEPNALPMIMTHGWPGAVLEFRKVIGPLTDPRNHGGDPADAFDLVLPMLPGFGFSGKPSETGWGIKRIARAWATLMDRLGYDHYVAQGGDWGSGVTTVMGVLEPRGLRAIHLNVQPVVSAAPQDGRALDEEEAAAFAQMAEFERWDSAYAKAQATRPQTIAYGLTDSPVGQAAWIYEKFWKWTDSDGDPENVLTKDEMLDIITLYWLTNTASSSARLYWESQDEMFQQPMVHLPVGCSIFPAEIMRAPRRWADACYSNIIHWNKVAKGGHFAAFEQPAIFCEELRNCFRQIRSGPKT